MPLQTIYKIGSVDREIVHWGDGLPVHVRPSGAPRMRESTVNQER